MSELLPGVVLLDGVGFPGRPGTVNVCLLVEHGEVLMVDAGFPGVIDPLETGLEALALTPGSVRRILVTHHHLDHTSGLPEVVALTDAHVLAHEKDVGYIEGTMERPGQPPSTGARAGLSALPPTKVDVKLHGGEDLGILGGSEVIWTPGHTPGHISLFLPKLSLLIAGDVVRYEQGRVVRPPEMYTADPEALERSLHLLAGYEFDAMLPYHGDYLASGASQAFRSDLGL